MASALYDSGWVPVASGTISTIIDLAEFQVAHLIFAASGTNPATGATATWIAGSTSPQPYFKLTPAYPCVPLITGSYTVANPAANTFSEYFFGGTMTGSSQLDPFPPMQLGVTLTPGAASWARVIVEVR